MLFIFVTSFPANSRPLLCMTTGHPKKFPARKHSLKPTRRGIFSEENQPCEDEAGFTEKKKRLPYFSRISFFQLSSLSNGILQNR
jgi:hypothetical protein